MIKKYISRIWKILQPKLPSIMFDIGSIPVSWYLSYWVRYNLEPMPKNLMTPHFFFALAVVLIVQSANYYYFKVYRGLWRFSSLNDVIRIIKSSLSGAVICTPILYLLSLLQDIPRSILPLYAAILVALQCGARLLLRIYADIGRHNTNITGIGNKVLVIGAGLAGDSLLRDLNRSGLYHVAGLVDDNLSKKGLEVHGVRVLGTTKDLTNIIQAKSIDLIFIAIPSIRSAAMRRIVYHCELCKVPFRTLPSIQALASGQVRVNELREVNLEDLLGRDQVQLNWDKIFSNIQSKRVLVTGAGGSIGSELCRQIMNLKPKKILLLDNCEFNAYKIELELKSSFPEIPVEMTLVSVTDEIGIHGVFKTFKPQIVFHAAAFKHVHLLENQIRTAVHNNVIGTHIVAQASQLYKTEKFVLISTDKAVNPSNIMGLTKRIAEIYCQNLNLYTETKFITVRFGNVLGSVGSVVPLFQKQLEKGGPITVTHPDIKRYFMTISEACQLILQATANGHGGEIFVLDMGEAIKISYLAEQMIRLCGKIPNQDIHIKFVGLRPGEKLFEELFHAKEKLQPTEHEKLFKAQFREHDWDALSKTFNHIKKAMTAGNDCELTEIMCNIVPEFQNVITEEVSEFS